MSATGYSTEPQLLLFRRRLRERMRELGIDEAALGREVGQTRQAVSLWLVGLRLPQAPSLVRLSRALGVTSDWLLGFDEGEIVLRSAELLRRIRDSAATGVAASAPTGGMDDDAAEDQRSGGENG